MRRRSVLVLLACCAVALRATAADEELDTGDADMMSSLNELSEKMSMAEPYINAAAPYIEGIINRTKAFERATAGPETGWELFYSGGALVVLTLMVACSCACCAAGSVVASAIVALNCVLFVAWRCVQTPATAALSVASLLMLYKGGPADCVEWLYVCAQLWALQLGQVFNTGGSVFSWPRTQWEISNVLGLEGARRREVLRDARLGIDSLAAPLPHVDTQSAPPSNEDVIASSGLGAKLRWLLRFGCALPPPPPPEPMVLPEPIVKDLVLIGGGHSHAYTLKNFGMNPMPGVQLTLITRDVATPYSGMMPGHIAGVYSKAECHIDLAKLARFANARLIHAEACGIDTEKKVVHLVGRPAMAYDVLSINIGSTPSASSKIEDDGVTKVKPIDGFAARWEQVVQRVSTREAKNQKDEIVIVVVGAGAGGVELCLSMQARLQKELQSAGDDPAKLNMVLIGRNVNPMPAHGSAVQREFSAILEQRGVLVCTGSGVESASNGVLTLSNGETQAYDEAIWCTQAGAAPWLRSSGLALDKGGFIKVDVNMRSSDASVFAAGDCCALADERPKAGVFAVRAGPPLTNNIRATLAPPPVVKSWLPWRGAAPLLEPYEPQKFFLGIIGTGTVDVAVASRGPMAMKGKWVWKLKDWIDRKWMAQYTSHLPEMPEAVVPAPDVARAAGPKAIKQLSELAMRCGGCGAKVGATVLERALKHLNAPSRPEVIVGLDAPDDCAVVDYNAATLHGGAGANQGMSAFVKTRSGSGGGGLAGGGGGTATRQPVHVVHSVDFFRSFIGDPYVFGQASAAAILDYIGAPPQ